MDGSFWVLLIALLLFATSLLVHRVVDGAVSIVQLPLTWFYASWIIGLALLALPFFKYFESFSISSGSYLIAVLFVYSVGSVLASFWSRRSVTAAELQRTKGEVETNEQISSRFLGVLLIMGLVGSTLLLLNSILSSGLSLADRLNTENFAAIRSAHMESQVSRIGLLYGPASVMSAIGGLGVAMLLFLVGAKRYAASNRKFMVRLGYFVMGVNVIIGFIGFGSRMFALFALLVGILGFLQGRWSIGERIISMQMTLGRLMTVFVSVICALAIAWVTATTFLQQRVQSLDPQSLLFRTHRAHLAPFAYEVTRHDVALQYFMFSTSYLSTPIPTLIYYLDLPSARQPGPFYGEYNFPAIARWTRRFAFVGDPTAWDRARFEIFKPLGDIGFGTNVWSSMVRDLIADFGKGGALFFIGVFGFFAQRIFQLQDFRPTAVRAGLLVYLRIILAFAGLISLLFQPQIHWPLYVAIVLLIFSRNGKAQKRKSERFAGNSTQARFRRT